MHMLILDDAAYPNPTDLQADPSGILGENTFVFQAESRHVITSKGKIALIQIANHTGNIDGDAADVYQVTLSSGAGYEPAMILDRSQHTAYGIPDLFGDSQFAFRCSEGVFVTQRDMVRSLMRIDRGRTVHVQPTE